MLQHLFYRKSANCTENLSPSWGDAPSYTMKGFQPLPDEEKHAGARFFFLLTVNGTRKTLCQQILIQTTTQ